MKTVIITGGAYRIGEETSLLFSERMAKVVIVGRNEKRFKEIVAKSHIKIDFIKCDLSERNQVLDLCRKINQKYDKVHLLINNASRNSRFSVLDIELGEWDEVG